MALINKIDKTKIPKHIAIIMDGNRRWAQNNNLIKNFGHREGVKRVKDIVEASLNLNLEVLTVFAFSTENWGRDKKEVSFLMSLLLEFLNSELEKLHSNNVKINVLGDKTYLTEKIREKVITAEKLTCKNSRMLFNVALSYGSRKEIIDAVKIIAKDIKENKLSLDDINEESFKKYLYSKNIPDPDLLIRTSGEIRLSNFLLYQLAYTEFYFTDVLWPDFTKNEYYKVIIDFQKRNRRYGVK